MGNSILGIGGEWWKVVQIQMQLLISYYAILSAGTYGTAQICRQRSINHALASNEMLRMTGAPARGWYPKQRNMRPASTENIDRLASVRVWDNPAGMSGTGQSRKPLTLPPNLTPSFLNKSPREALRRVTSLLITKKSKCIQQPQLCRSESNVSLSLSLLQNTARNASTRPTAINPWMTAIASMHMNLKPVSGHLQGRQGIYSNSYYLFLLAGSAKRKESSSRKDNAAAGVATTPKAKKKGLFKSLWKRTKTASLDQ